MAVPIFAICTSQNTLRTRPSRVLEPFLGEQNNPLFFFFLFILVDMEALGAGFLIVSALEIGLKILCFSRFLWGSWMAPQNKGTTWVRGK